jgi:hypothetical protein
VLTSGDVAWQLLGRYQLTTVDEKTLAPLQASISQAAAPLPINIVRRRCADDPWISSRWRRLDHHGPHPASKRAFAFAVEGRSRFRSKVIPLSSSGRSPDFMRWTLGARARQDLDG